MLSTIIFAAIGAVLGAFIWWCILQLGHMPAADDVLDEMARQRISDQLGHENIAWPHGTTAGQDEWADEWEKRYKL